MRKNIEIQDIKQKRAKELYTREPLHTLIPAVIIEVEGSTTPNNRPNYLWVKIYGYDAPRVVRNGTTITVVDTPVIIEIDPKKPEEGRVIGIYDATLAPDSDINVIQYQTGPHRQNHQYPTEATVGTDAVLIYQPAIQPLKVTGDSATLTVTVQAHVYVETGVRYFFGGGTLDLTSYVPATASRVQRVLVYLNKSTNMVTVQAGTEVVDNGIIPIPYPIAPRNSKPAAYVKLSTGQTAVSTITHIEDARDILGSDDLSDYTVFQWIWADSAERAATAVSSEDVYHLGLQIDDWSVWVLADTTPTWEAVGGGGTAASFITEDAVTDDYPTTEVLVLGHNSTGTPAAGLGVAIEFTAETSTTESQSLGRLGLAWANITHATRQSMMQLFLTDNNGEHEVGVIRVRNSTPVIGDARGDGAIDFQTGRQYSTQVASGAYSTIVSGGGYNTASGEQATIIGSAASEASGFSATIIGGSSHTASGDSSVIAGGQSNETSGESTAVLGGSNNEAIKDYSVVVGGLNGVGRRYGEVVNSLAQNGGGTIILLPHQDVVHSSTAWFSLELESSNTEYIVLQTDSVMVFDVLLVGTTQGCTKSFGFRLTGVIENDGGTTSLLGTPTVTTLYNADDVSFEAQAIADNTNDALDIQVRDTDAGGNSVRWMGYLRAVETVFPA